ncbi:hypothetical protein ACFPRA_09075 [Sporosarcina soli]|uniref:Uncharacterized protein n=1 Tax=Sporosarcina soli TaxID=334736 RepID=A0ABW0TJ85_9BACL
MAIQDNIYLVDEVKTIELKIYKDSISKENAMIIDVKDLITSVSVEWINKTGTSFFNTPPFYFLSIYHRLESYHIHYP